MGLNMWIVVVSPYLLVFVDELGQPVQQHQAQRLVSIRTPGKPKHPLSLFVS